MKSLECECAFIVACICAISLKIKHHLDLKPNAPMPSATEGLSVMKEDEIHRLFESGKIICSTDESLQNILNDLASSAVLNDNTRHRAVIRAQAINYILMQRHIDKLNNQNTKTQHYVMVLAILSFIASCVQVYTAFNQERPVVIVQQQPPKL